MRPAFLLSLALLLTATAPGCGVEDTFLLASAPWDGDAGLVLELEDGATLDMPPGSASGEGEVRFTRESCSGVFAAPEFLSCLYRVETDLEILEPFHLSLPRSEDEAGGMIEELEGGYWPLYSSADETGPDTPATLASSLTPTSFSVRDPTLTPADTRCAEVEFAPCGGDVSGSWTLDLACGTMAQVAGISFEGPDPYEACEVDGHVRDLPFRVSGSLQADADGFTWTTSAYTVWEHEITTEGCLKTVGETCNEDCTLEDGLCTCTFEKASGVGGHTGAFTSADLESSVCVEGDRLLLELASETGPYWLVYQRE